jgi:hypothetical protein
LQLALGLTATGTPAALALRQRHLDGEFDATKEEADACEHNGGDAMQPEWAKWYRRMSWCRRCRDQLRLMRLCEQCEREGRLTPATCVDHVEPHEGDYNKFRLGALQSLCAIAITRRRRSSRHADTIRRSAPMECRSIGAILGRG